MTLTMQQSNVLHFIHAYIKEIGYPPSLREIRDGVKLKSSSTVAHHLTTLHELGYIRRAHDIPRGLVLMPKAEDYFA